MGLVAPDHAIRRWRDLVALRAGVNSAAPKLTLPGVRKEARSREVRHLNA
jgi:hypothetical protein